MRATSAALAALMLTAGVAEAARLTTPIQNAASPGAANCRLSYFGQKKNLPVKVTIIGYADQPGPYFPQSRTFKMGPNNRGVQLLKTCDEPGGDLGCDAVRCVFDIPSTVSPFDFAGAVCHPYSPDGTGRYCSSAVAR